MRVSKFIVYFVSILVHYFKSMKWFRNQMDLEFMVFVSCGKEKRWRIAEVHGHTRRHLDDCIRCLINSFLVLFLLQVNPPAKMYHFSDKSVIHILVSYQICHFLQLWWFLNSLLKTFIFRVQLQRQGSPVLLWSGIVWANRAWWTLRELHRQHCWAKLWTLQGQLLHEIWWDLHSLWLQWNWWALFLPS